jgi:PTS system mannose-specific IIB component/fructoselysine and glucoselysine-specific PTS system IIB component
MPIVLYRVDDRLVHGQVVLGWGKPLHIGLVVLVDSEVFGSEWERDLYRMGMPPEMELRFADVATALREYPGWADDARPVIVLTGDIGTMALLRQGGMPIAKVNLGGIHHKVGRTPRLPYIYLTEDEYQALVALETSGAQVTAQDLPTTPAVPLAALH